jgi:hypothetical protein
MTTIDNRTDFKVNLVELGKYIIGIGSIAWIVSQYVNTQQRVDDRQNSRIENLELNRLESKEEMKAIRAEMKQGFEEVNNKLDDERKIILHHTYSPDANETK